MYYFIKVSKIAEKLERIDSFTLNDFFVEITYNNTTRITTTKWDNAFPEWNETFIFPDRAKNIKLSLMENNRWSSSNIVKEESLEILDDGNLTKTVCSCIEIEHGYVTVKSAKSQIKIMENLGNIAQYIGNGFSNLTNELKQLTL
tara:strand:- start:1457 stop:1891 length:435 start_codon:yes stop_codon:yes gene_type:complete